MSPRLHCRFCENDDPSLLETTDHGELYCTVCSRVSRPTRSATAGFGMTPPIPSLAGPGPLAGGGSGRHDAKGGPR